MVSKKISLCVMGEEIIFDDDDTLILYFLNRIRSQSSYITVINQYIYSMYPKVFFSESWLHRYENLQFFQLFRMEKNTFHQFVATIGRTDVQKILQRKYTGGHHPIDLNGHVLIFLWYMATQDTLLSIGTRFGVSPTAVMKVVNKMLYITLKLKGQYVRFPACEQERSDIANGFRNYPGVIGALDGSHIFIKVEKVHADSYIDRYRRDSINLMAICDSNTLFLYVFVGFPGSAHDSRVFENSSLFINIERYGPEKYFGQEKKYHLIGDSAFALRTWLITPYRGDNQTRVQRFHNYKLSSERIKIEHCFGNLKGRWRRIQYINTYNICKTVEIASAACVLHNYCILKNDIWDEEYIEERLHVEPVRALRYDNREARIKRDNIAYDLFNNR